MVPPVTCTHLPSMSIHQSASGELRSGRAFAGNNEVIPKLKLTPNSGAFALAHPFGSRPKGGKLRYGDKGEERSGDLRSVCVKGVKSLSSTSPGSRALYSGNRLGLITETPCASLNPST